MRTLFIVLGLLGAVCVVVPVGIVVSLAAITAVGTSAATQYESEADVRQTSVSTKPRLLTGPATYQLDRVTLNCNGTVSASDAQRVLELLASRCLLGSSTLDHEFNLFATADGVQMTCLDPMSAEVCQSMRPVHQMLATMVSHRCFAGRPVVSLLTPTDSDQRLKCASRDDVGNVWTDGTQSVFFGHSLTPDAVQPAIDRLLEMKLLGEGSDLTHLFIRRLADSGAIEIVSSEKLLKAADPIVLRATLRDIAMLCSLQLFGGSPTTATLTNMGFEPLMTVRHQPPFKAAGFARNGCMLYAADDSISQASLNAIALRLTTIPGRELSIDTWIRRSGDGVTVTMPLQDRALADSDFLGLIMQNKGQNIKSELDLDGDVRVVACDYQLNPKREILVNKHAGRYVARQNSRLFYRAPFEAAFANRAADFFVDQNLFTEGGSVHVELMPGDAPLSRPRILMRIDRESLTPALLAAIADLATKTCRELFPDQVSVFQLCRRDGTPMNEHEIVIDPANP